MDNIYIKIIEAWLSFDWEFTRDELVTKMNANEIEKNIISRHITSATHALATWTINDALFFKIQWEKYLINTSWVFDYFDYKELQLAKENAESANQHAIKALKQSNNALCISALLALSSIAIWIFTRNTPININQNQLEKITFSNREIVDEVYDSIKILKDTNKYLDKIDWNILKLIK